MPFAFSPNVAEFGGASWSNFIKTVPGTTPQSAQRIAMADPAITFFFYCRQSMVLTGKGTFNPGDAVFFSGTPWPGSAPQADIYQKDFFTTAYVEVNSNSFTNAGCYTLQDGRQFFDIACIFAANINAGTDGNPVLYYNPQVTAVLNSDAVKTLQDLGITVLLTVLGNHENAGWSCFTDQSVAQGFVNQLAAAVTTYGLDGIDIDDEYSNCKTNLTSLTMVTTLMQQTMPGKIISKALFQDIQYFGQTWGGNTLANTLTYGWEMSYGDPAYGQRLQPYVKAGMGKNQLAIGVSTDSCDGDPAASFVKSNGYGGVMVFNVNNNSTNCLSEISNALYSETTVAKPSCLS
jgi:hypothetical protein